MSNSDNGPALYDHCLDVYGAMHHQADAGGEQEEGYPVWQGFLVKLITKDLNFSVPYYTNIMSALKAMDCVRQLKRGGGGAPSRWVLLTEPTRERFDKMVPVKSLAPSKEKKSDIQLQMIRDLNDRLKVVEDAILP